MTNEEQTSLWNQYAETRERFLRDNLVSLYLPLSHSIARKFTGRGMELEDLEQIASLALISAVERYRPELGFRFVTYGVSYIAGTIRHELRNLNGSFSLPRNSMKTLQAIENAKTNFEQREMRSPTPQELANEVKIPVQDLLTLQYINFSMNTVSLNAPVSENDELMLSSFLAFEEEGYQRIDSQERYSQMLRNLTDQERKLIRFRYEDGMTQRETAQQLGVSQMQVSRIEKRILLRLKTILMNE